MVTSIRIYFYDLGNSNLGVGAGKKDAEQELAIFIVSLKLGEVQANSSWYLITVMLWEVGFYCCRRWEFTVFPKESHVKH